MPTNHKSRLFAGVRAVLALIILTPLSIAAVPSTAATLNVPSQYATISAAMTAASNGDTIVLAPGTYSGSGNVNLTVTKALTVTSSGGAANTILDCGNAQFISSTSVGPFELQGVTVENCTSSFGVIYVYATATVDNCVFKNNNIGNIEFAAIINANIFTGNSLSISNCTFQNNQALLGCVQPGGLGSTVSVTNTVFNNNSGAIYSNSASGTISNCTFTNNSITTNEYGGAVYWINGPLTVTDTSFTGNSTSIGGGAMFVGASGLNTPVTLTRCVFSGNSVTNTGGYGGGCFLISESSQSTSVTANDCQFVDNSAPLDGPVFAVVPGISNDAVDVTNCSFYGNRYTGGSPSGCGAISSDSSTILTIKNSILYGDATSNEISTNHPAHTTTVTYSDIHQSGYAGSNGNINADPMYAAAGSGDLHITNASPCIQAGTATGAPSADFDQYAWGSTVSMGAFSPLHFALTTPGTATAGSAFSFSATATAADNTTTITNYAGTVHFTSSDSLASLPSDTTLTNGTRTFSATMNSSGSQTITAADTSTTAYTSTSAGISVAGLATHFSISTPATATAGSAFHVTVTALDAQGNTATGYAGTVHFTATDGLATLPADATLTNGVGTFSVTLDTAGSQTVTATDTVTSSITGTSRGIAVGAGAATHLSVSAPATATAGTSFNVTVTALDQFGNTATGYAGTVHFTSSDAAAVLPADTTLTSGVGTFSVTLKTAGSQTVSATDTVTSSITGLAMIPVNAANATHLVVVAVGASNDTAGTAIVIAVDAEDQFGNTDANYSGTVHFTSSDGSAKLPPNSTLSHGSATFSATLNTLGSQTITATDTVQSTITGTTQAIVVGPSTPTAFTISAPSTAAAGTPFNITVTALDAYGNTATGYTGTVHFTSTDSTGVLPTDSTLTNGVGTFSVTLKTAGSQTVTATDTVTSSIAGTSGTVAVSAASATHLTLSIPAGQYLVLAGDSVALYVTAFDSYGNIAKSYSGDIHFTSTDANAVLPPDSSLVNGTGTFSVTFTKPGSNTVTGTDTDVSSITGVSNTVPVYAGIAAKLVITTPSNVVAGVPFNFTVTAYDKYGNVATGFSDKVGFASSDSAAILPASSLLVNGTGAKTFSATLVTGGNQTISAADISYTPERFPATSNPIAVSAGAATHFTVSAPSTAIVGVPFNVTVSALDTYGNTATAYAGTVHLTSTDSLAVLPADGTLANGVKAFSVTLKTPGSQTVTATDTTSASITGSATVAVTANALHTFAPGLQMIAAPADYSGFSMSQIFSPNDEAVVAWNASTSTYAIAPAAPADTIRPGVGYWAKFKSSTDLLDLGVHTSPSTPVKIHVVPGWNLIGNPFSTAVSLSTTSITTNTVDAASFAYAVANQLVSPNLYTFTAGATGYQQETQTLQPYAGYWIYAYVDCTLSIP